MRFTLYEIFEQAQLDKYSINVNAPPFKGRLLYGIKIINCYRAKTKVNEVTILNTQKGGDQYQEISPNDYEVFQSFGWNYGVYVLSLSNCSLKMDKISGVLEFEESQVPRRDKYIEGAKRQFNKTKSLHSSITNKFNQFKSINYDKSQK
jgi:hypothetical protein|tara:strand:+ start:1704 stop:2150 length:447 start_codon:yes stop_codon:yes gene_type:complete